MFYPSHADTHPATPDDLAREQREDAARDVLAAAMATCWFNPDTLGELTPHLQTVIAKCLASHGFRMQGAIWGRPEANLLRAWDAYLPLDSDAQLIDNAAQVSF